MNFGLTGTTVLVGVLFAIALLFQVRARRYMPTPYWIAVVFVSVSGTLITDNLSDHPCVPLAVSTGLFSAALAITYAVWYEKEKLLSIHAIDTDKRELFYWAAILFTFALGTAAGDWAAEGLSLGYANSTLLFGGLIGITAFARYVFKADASQHMILRSRGLAEWLVWLVPLGLIAGWLSGSRSTRGALLSASVSGIESLLVNKLIGLVWYHPRPFELGLGNSFLQHAQDSSFPSDHLTLICAALLSPAIRPLIRAAWIRE